MVDKQQVTSTMIKITISFPPSFQVVQVKYHGCIICDLAQLIRAQQTRDSKVRVPTSERVCFPNYQISIKQPMN